MSFHPITDFLYKSYQDEATCYVTGHGEIHKIEIEQKTRIRKQTFQGPGTKQGAVFDNRTRLRLLERSLKMPLMTRNRFET